MTCSRTNVIPAQKGQHKGNEIFPKAVDKWQDFLPFSLKWLHILQLQVKQRCANVTQVAALCTQTPISFALTTQWHRGLQLWTNQSHGIRIRWTAGTRNAQEKLTNYPAGRSDITTNVQTKRVYSWDILARQIVLRSRIRWT